MKIRLEIISIIFLIGILKCQSQDLKLITQQSDHRQQTEEYYVLKSNKDVKQGEYILKNHKGKIIEKGYFNNNKKDSIWICFSYDGRDTSSVGRFKNNKPIGKWKIFNREGKLRYIYDYSINEVIEYNWYDDANLFPILIENKWIEDSIDSPPLIVGNEYPSQLIVKEILYPIRAVENGISGQVVVAFTIDSVGTMSNVRIKKSVDPDIDAEALRVTKLIKSDWFPAKKNGKPITIEYSFPITFQLQ